MIDKPWKRLWNEDLLPYRELPRHLPFVMVAHAAYPQVTGDRTPASLSKKWMSEVLRKKIGYRGLIITDDLDMGGVLAAASIEDAAVETLRAGADMFLVCQKEESVWRAFEAVYKPVSYTHLGYRGRWLRRQSCHSVTGEARASGHRVRQSVHGP